MPKSVSGTLSSHFYFVCPGNRYYILLSKGSIQGPIQCLKITKKSHFLRYFRAAKVFEFSRLFPRFWARFTRNDVTLIKCVFSVDFQTLCVKVSVLIVVSYAGLVNGKWFSSMIHPHCCCFNPARPILTSAAPPFDLHFLNEFWSILYKNLRWGNWTNFLSNTMISTWFGGRGMPHAHHINNALIKQMTSDFLAPFSSVGEIFILGFSSFWIFVPHL